MLRVWDPFIGIRTISDYANHEHNTVDVKKFVYQASGYYSVAVINNLYSLINDYIYKNR